MAPDTGQRDDSVRMWLVRRLVHHNIFCDLLVILENVQNDQEKRYTDFVAVVISTDIYFRPNVSLDGGTNMPGLIPTRSVMDCITEWWCFLASTAKGKDRVDLTGELQGFGLSTRENLELHPVPQDSWMQYIALRVVVRRARTIRWGQRERLLST